MPKLLHCPNCGELGYRRKVKRPEWRCTEKSCGYEWDSEPDPELASLDSYQWRRRYEEQNFVSVSQFLLERFPQGIYGEVEPRDNVDDRAVSAPEPTPNAGSQDAFKDKNAFNDMGSFVGWLLAMVLVVFVGVMCVTQGFPDQGGGDPYKGMPDRPADSYPRG